MKISLNPNATYNLSELSIVEFELIANLLLTEAYRISILSQLEDAQLASVFLNDSTLLNNIAEEKQIDVDILKNLLSNPQQIKELRESLISGKHLNALERLNKKIMDFQTSLNDNIS